MPPPHVDTSEWECPCEVNELEERMRAMMSVVAEAGTVFLKACSEKKALQEGSEMLPSLKNKNTFVLIAHNVNGTIAQCHGGK